MAISLINKHMCDDKNITLQIGAHDKVRVITLSGNSPDDYNDIGRETVIPYENNLAVLYDTDNTVTLSLPAHSINIVTIYPSNR